MIVYCNNCKGRKHAQLYGKSAFYDLDPIRDARKATDLRPGQICIVATRTGMGDKIDFGKFSFLREELKKDNEGQTCRVWFGKFVKSVSMSQRVAARTKAFSEFFAKNGYFKRIVVLER